MGDVAYCIGGPWDGEYRRPAVSYEIVALRTEPLHLSFEPEEKPQYSTLRVIEGKYLPIGKSIVDSGVVYFEWQGWNNGR